jgi:methionyl-tRNA formyltransferase
VARLVFFGLPLGALLLAADGHELQLAVLAPVEAPGAHRLRRVLGSPRVLAASELGERLEREVDARLAALDPELVVSWYWTRRLPERWLARASVAAIGAHPSLLPRHRGPDPFFWTIDSGDAECGVSVHFLTAEYDRGDVIRRFSLDVGDRNAWQLARALDRPSLALLREVVADFARGVEIRAEAQDARRATWAPEPGDEELRVDWRWPTERVLRRIRALAPVPGLALELEGVAFFVTRADAARRYPSALTAGEAASVGDPPELVIRTGDGAIRVLEAVEAGQDEPRLLSQHALGKLVASRNCVV